MNKTQLNNELKIWNTTKVVNGINIAMIAWYENPWRIIPDGEYFEQSASREFKPLKEFHTRKELVDYLFKELLKEKGK